MVTAKKGKLLQAVIVGGVGTRTLVKLLLRDLPLKIGEIGARTKRIRKVIRTVHSSAFYHAFRLPVTEVMKDRWGERGGEKCIRESRYMGVPVQLKSGREYRRYRRQFSRNKTHLILL
jgi:hypothetical protein